MAEAFYLPDGERLVATELTRGPWHAQLQHAGPPSALLARAAVRLGEPMQVCRITVDLLRPVPARAVEDSTPYAFDFFLSDVGYHTAMELRLAAGGPGLGRALMWMRPRVALVAGEPIHPAARAMIVADSGNGISYALDPRRYTFMNADLDLCFARMPQGEWIGLDARTEVQPFGLGCARSRLLDRRGMFGSGVQNLLIEPIRDRS